MKRKTNKKSGIIAAVVGLSAVSLVSVGFASWVMSGGDSLDLSGEISVESVDDNRYFIYNKSSVAVHYGNAQGKDKGNQTASKIVFGIDASTQIDGAWLTAGGVDENAPKYENLTASVELWVANLPANATTSITAQLVPTNSEDGETEKTGFYAAIQHGYVKQVPNAAISVTNDTDNKGTVEPNIITFRKVTISIEFEWGATFEYVNPYKFYNTGKTASGYVNSNNPVQTWGDHAKEHLLQLEEDLSGVGFTLKIATLIPNA